MSTFKSAFGTLGNPIVSQRDRIVDPMRGIRDMVPNSCGISSAMHSSTTNDDNRVSSMTNPVCCLCNSTSAILGDYVLTAEMMEKLHDCLAHLPNDRIKANFESGHVIGPKVDPGIYKNSHKHICTICLRSKLTRRSHQGSLPVHEKIGRLFGADVYGPMSVSKYTR